MSFTRLIAPWTLSVLLAGGPALAQHHQTASPQMPYSGLETRPIKALSSDQIADLRAGRGMGLALSAELNGYPGPIHALEHAAALALTDEQRTRVQSLYEAMRAEAVPLGERLISQEADLDRLFAERAITPTSLDRTTAEIGRTEAALRAAHLKYHIAMLDVLTPDQVRHYAELRGYRASNRLMHGHGGQGRD
jgi:Spy/CpxP family protein refolding chaperone